MAQWYSLLVQGGLSDTKPLTDPPIRGFGSSVVAGLVTRWNRLIPGPDGLVGACMVGLLKITKCVRRRRGHVLQGMELMPSVYA